MSFKTTYAMFIVLIALLAIFGIWQAFGTKPGTESYVMASMHKAKINSDNIDGVVVHQKDVLGHDRSPIGRTPLRKSCSSIPDLGSVHFGSSQIGRRPSKGVRQFGAPRILSHW